LKQEEEDEESEDVSHSGVDKTDERLGASGFEKKCGRMMPRRN